MASKAVFTENQINFIRESKGQYNTSKEFYTAFNTKFRNNQKTSKQLIDKIRYIFGNTQEYYSNSTSKISKLTGKLANEEVVYFLKYGIKGLNKLEILDYLKVLFNINTSNSQLTNALKVIRSSYKISAK